MALVVNKKTTEARKRSLWPEFEILDLFELIS
jgi:hypothetical protein